MPKYRFTTIPCRVSGCVSMGVVMTSVGSMDLAAHEPAAPAGHWIVCKKKPEENGKHVDQTLEVNGQAPVPIAQQRSKF